MIKTRTVVITIMLFFTLLALALGCCFVPYDKYGVVVRLGKVDSKTLSPGLYFFNPFTTRVETIDSQVQAVTLDNLEASTSDGQIVKSTIVLNYTIKKDMAAYVYKELNYKTYRESIVKPEVNEKLKDVISHYTAIALVTDRDKVSREVRELVEKTFLPQGLELLPGGGCSITNFELSPQFKESIELKVIAEQEALRAKNELEKTKAEAEQAIEKAKGASEAADVIAKSITTPYVFYKAVEKWNGELPTHVFLGTGDAKNILPVVDVAKTQELN